MSSGARRIIFVNRFFYPDQSATSRMLSDLAFAMADRGMAVRVITTSGLYDDPAADLPAQDLHRGVDIRRVYRPRFSRGALWGRAFDSLAMYAAFAAAILRHAVAGDCLVVKTDPPLLSVALAPIARLKRLSMVNWLQDLYPEVALALGFRALAPAAPLLRAARNASLKRAAQNVVISGRMRAHLEAEGLDPARITLIQNWCDDDALLPVPQERNALRRDWGLTDKFVIGYSGNLGRAHEYATLVAAAEKLRDDDDIRFLFIGGGHQIARLKAEVARRGLRSFVFQPYQDDAALPFSLGAADIHWLSQPAAMEGLILPSKFYGIAAAGRPIIVVGDVEGELSSLVQREACGAAIATGDGEALAALIRALKADRRRLAQMGANARRMLENDMTQKKAFDAWSDLLERV